MPDLDRIYHEENARYDRMISREDYQGNLLGALHRITPLEGQVVIDTGAGTGRIARMLLPLAKRVYAFDLNAHMLESACQKMRETGQGSWVAASADHRRLPVPGATADLLVSGWSFIYLWLKDPQGGPDQTLEGLREIERVLRPGGTVAIIETLGTGYEQPVRFPRYEPYFAFLEASGFQSTQVHTDYHFESLAEAVELSSFFFGEELARQVKENDWLILPECTGIWWKTF